MLRLYDEPPDQVIHLRFRRLVSCARDRAGGPSSNICRRLVVEAPTVEAGKRRTEAPT